MKTITKLSVFLLFILVTACSKSDDSKPTEPVIDGQWKLKYVNGSITGASYYFESGVVNGTFNPSDQTVVVENNNTNNNLNDLFPSGTYSYEIIDNSSDSSCSQILKIDIMELGCLTIEENNLTMNQTFADGFQVHLVR